LLSAAAAYWSWGLQKLLRTRITSTGRASPCWPTIPLPTEQKEPASWLVTGEHWLLLINKFKLLLFGTEHH
jgi:hypothetical protein